MGRPRKTANVAAAAIKDDLLSLLSPERQREILEEVIGVHVRSLFEAHQGGTLGELVDALKGHQHWEKIRQINVSSVMRQTGPAPRAATVARTAAKVSPPKGRGGRPSKLDESTLDSLVDFISKHPNIRSEEIQKQVEIDKAVVKAGLAKLREAGRVRTAGAKRATTYSVA